MPWHGKESGTTLGHFYSIFTFKTMPEDSQQHALHEEAGMPFLDHLEELRWRIIKSLIAIGVGCIICFYASDTILNILVRPAKQIGIPIMNMRVIGMFMVKLNIALVGGIILALPIVLYQLWSFVAPGLLSRERRYVQIVIPASVLGFLIGAAIAYFLVLPGALRFLSAMSADYVTNYYSIGDYVGFLLRLILAFGVVFELPVIAFFLAKFGILTPELLRHYRRYAIVAIFLVAAILTPGPDPLSQLMMAIPLLILYEVSIFVAKIAQR
jgi:sec-independent protein translocase protein TatC